jgi:hypothetical protein
VITADPIVIYAHRGELKGENGDNALVTDEIKNIEKKPAAVDLITPSEQKALRNMRARTIWAIKSSNK